MIKNKKARTSIRWLVFLLALEIIAIAVNFFYGPINIAAGGSTGISILVEAVWGIRRSLTVFIINLIMLILAAIFLGKETTKKVALGSVLLPLFMQITPSFKVTDNELLAIIYGGVLMGVGISLLYRVDASPGGTTIPPMIFKKYFYINTAIGLLGIDMIVIFLNIFVDGWNAFLLAALSQVITSITMNYTEAGFDRKYQVRIMSDTHFDEINSMLINDYTGLTLYDVIGGYSEDHKTQMLIVINPHEYGPLISKIHKIDPDAFIISDVVVKVHGGRWNL